MILYSEIGIIIYLVTLIGLFYLTYKNKWYMLDEKNLLKQKLFWLSIGIPVFSFCYFGMFAWWGKTPVLNANGYSRFYEISKFPLMLLASSVPLGAIVNNIHRTIQTETQLSRTESQIEMIKIKNKSDSFYAHQKSYADIFKTLPPFIVNRKYTEHDDNKKFVELSISHPYILYMNIFTNSSIDEGYNKTVSPHFIERVERNYYEINKAIQMCYNQDINWQKEKKALQLLEVNIIKLCSELGVNYRHEKHEFLVMDQSKGVSFTISFSDETQIKQMVTGLRDLLIHLYTLVGLIPSSFLKPRGQGDLIPDYGYDNMMIFRSILPIEDS